MTRRSYLLTGVTGFLGKVLLEELVRRREELRIDRLLVVIRPLGGRDAAARFARDVAPSPCFAALPQGWERIVTVIEADLERPELPASLGHHAALREVTHVVHAAASVRFNLPLALAARANVHATLSVLALARSLPSVERFVYVSTAYVTPHRGAMPIEETLVTLPGAAGDLFAACTAPAMNAAAQVELLASTRHPNSYTYTKAIAEHLVVERRGRLAVTIVRPSIVTASVAHPVPGWIDSASGIAGFLMLGGMGYLRALVCNPEARLDLIPVDEVSGAIVRATLDGPAGAGATPARADVEIRHCVLGAAQAPTVALFWEVARQFFIRHPVNGLPRRPYLGPRGPRFWVADLLWHRLPLLVAGLRSRAVRRQARKLGMRIALLNSEFTYFLTHTFDFRTATPIDHLGGAAAGTLPADPRETIAYIETITRGVHRHLLTRGTPAAPAAADGTAVGAAGQPLAEGIPG